MVMVLGTLSGLQLRPYLALLCGGEKAAFVAHDLAALTQAYPALADGTVLLPFPRLFILASR